MFTPTLSMEPIILDTLASVQMQRTILAFLYYLPVTHPDTNRIYNSCINMLSTARELVYAQNQVSNTNMLIQNMNQPKNVNLVGTTHGKHLNSTKEKKNDEDTDSSQTQAERRPNDSRIALPLSQPSDKKKLSKLQCFLREQIEFFAATPEDVNAYSTGRNRDVKVGQVGIRCIHCSVLSVKERSKGSTYFPSTLAGIYQASQNIYHHHFCTGCPKIAETCASQFNDTDALSNRSCHGGGKDYWSMSAERMGLIETAVGLRFGKHSCDTDDGICHEINQSSLRQLDELAAKDTASIVHPNDRKLTTDYIFMLYSQMLPCNRAKASSSRLPGFVCKHCGACNESGAFFRKTVSSLSKNEYLSKIDEHLSQCPLFPEEIKATLKKLKEIHGHQMRGLKRGDKKEFFTRNMRRIHD